MAMDPGEPPSFEGGSAPALGVQSRLGFRLLVGPGLVASATFPYRKMVIFIVVIMVARVAMATVVVILVTVVIVSIVRILKAAGLVKHVILVITVIAMVKIMVRQVLFCLPRELTWEHTRLLP